MANGDVARAMVNQGETASIVCDSACLRWLGSGTRRRSMSENNANRSATRSASLGRADRDIKRMGSMASGLLFELDDAAANEHGAAEVDGDPAGSQIPYQRMD